MEAAKVTHLQQVGKVANLPMLMYVWEWDTLCHYILLFTHTYTGADTFLNSSHNIVS